MSGRLRLLRRSRQDLPRWPRFREGAKQDERRWIEQLRDRELARLAAELHAIDKAVAKFKKGRA